MGVGMLLDSENDLLGVWVKQNQLRKKAEYFPLEWMDAVKMRAQTADKTSQ